MPSVEKHLLQDMHIVFGSLHCHRRCACPSHRRGVHRCRIAVLVALWAENIISYLFFVSLYAWKRQKLL